MPVKYHCPKCGRRFTDWGAEKLGYKCPPDCTDQDSTLVRVGSQTDEPAKRPPTLKRRKKAEEAVVVPVFAGYDADEEGATEGLPVGGDDAVVTPFADEEGAELEEVADGDFDGDAADDED